MSRAPSRSRGIRASCAAVLSQAVSRGSTVVESAQHTTTTTTNSIRTQTIIIILMLAFSSNFHRLLTSCSVVWNTFDRFSRIFSRIWGISASSICRKTNSFVTIQCNADVSNTADARECCTNVFIFALGRFISFFRVT